MVVVGGFDWAYHAPPQLPQYEGPTRADCSEDVNLCRTTRGPQTSQPAETQADNVPQNLLKFHRTTTKPMYFVLEIRF